MTELLKHILIGGVISLIVIALFALLFTILSIGLGFYGE
jgi:hypothetical protein